MDSGFEIAVADAYEITQSYPEIKKSVGERNKVVSFTWGGDIAECTCAFAAAAGLVKIADGIAYYPADAVTYDMDGLAAEAKQCLADNI